MTPEQALAAIAQAQLMMADLMDALNSKLDRVVA